MSLTMYTRPFVLFAVPLVFAAWAAPSQADAFDTVIAGGRIIDGTGNPYYTADIGIKADSIVAIGRVDRQGAQIVDARGKYVAPGFIDMHSHADIGLSSRDPRERRAPNLVKQGITTVVVGADGENILYPLEKELAAYALQGIPLNVIPTVGHGTVRRSVMGEDYERPATRAEVERMRKRVRDAMQAGAWGLSAGPEYRPGRFSNTEELISLAKVVAEFDGFYIAHQRSQSPLPLWELPSTLSNGWRLTGTDAMKETIRIGREADLRVVGSHIKAKGPSTWGQSATDVLLIERARQAGVQAYLDQYPFETFGGTPTVVIPAWLYAPPGTPRSGGTDSPRWKDPALFDDYKVNLKANLADPATGVQAIADIEYVLDLQGGAERHLIVHAPHDRSLVGKTLSEVAADNGRTAVEQLVEFALEGSASLRSGVLFRPIAGSSYDVENYMRQEFTATSTDGVVALEAIPGHHPRHFATYPYKLAHYARDKELISLAFAVRSSSGLPARIIGLRDRGTLREGAKADIVVFDLEDLPSDVSLLDPDRCCNGIEHVLSNGEFIFRDGKQTGSLPGRVLLKSVSSTGE